MLLNVFEPFKNEKSFMNLLHYFVSLVDPICAVAACVLVSLCHCCLLLPDNILGWRKAAQ